jgi:ABC-type transport system involved in multi-copper enzyme maturation permease subunit
MPEPATLPSERGVASWRPGFSLVGPLFYHDLVRQARRGRIVLLRCAYAVLLFGALRYAFASRFPFQDVSSEFQPLSAVASTRELDLLGWRFVLSVLAFQTVAIFFVTPACVAGTFVEERNRKTFDALLTAHLSDMEIVLSKLASRVVQIYCLLLTGLPVMALTLLWGGVDYRILAVTALVSALNVVTVAALSIWCSVEATTMWVALGTSYFLSVFAYIVCTLLSVTPSGIYQVLGGFRPYTFSPAIGVLLNVVAAAAACLYAAKSLRSCEASPEETSESLRRLSRFDPVSQVARRNYYGQSPRFQLPNPWPPPGDWPLLWRETYTPLQRPKDFEPLDRDERHVTFLIVAGVLILGSFLTRPDETVVKPLICLAAIVLYCLAAFRAAAGVSRERDARTLETLLSLPVSRTEILGAKWLGPFLHFRLYGYLLALPLAIGIASGALHPLGAFLVVVAVVVHLSFLVSVGVCLSIACPTTVRARIATGVVLVLFLAGGLLELRGGESQASRATAPTQWRWLLAECGVNSIGAVRSFAFSWKELSVDPMLPARIAYSSAGTGVYALAAIAFWLAACWRFRKETGC